LEFGRIVSVLVNQQPSYRAAHITVKPKIVLSGVSSALSKETCLGNTPWTSTAGSASDEYARKRVPCLQKATQAEFSYVVAGGRMRKYRMWSPLIWAVLLVPAVNTPAQTAGWKQYTYSDDGFQASYPSPPDLQKKSVQTSAGEFELRSYAAAAGDTELIIGVCDYGPAVEGRSSDQMLLGAKNSTLSNSASHLLAEKKIALGKYPGVQFESENSATHFIVRMFMVATTLYEALVISPLNKPFDQSGRFLDSFQLVTRTKTDPKN
jgi:hypothetical protein